MAKFFFKRRHAFLPGLCCSLLLLSACATTMGTEDTIEKRATARWDLLFGGDYAGAYEFLSPGFRSSVSSLQYQKSLLLQRVVWTNAKYIESECTETTCKVSILLGYVVRGGLPGVKSFEGADVIKESWIKSDNIWYLVPKQ